MTAPRVLGLHGTKVRWAEPTIRQGLHRPSAAWFLMDRTPGRPAEPATFAAAVYLALGPSGRAVLGAGEPGVPVHEVFAHRPELLPILLVFDDEPTGAEVRHRYLWLGGGLRTARTDPYTKVGRAGRGVGPPLPVADVLRVSLDDVARSKAGMAPAGPGWAEGEPLVHRIEPDSDARPGPGHPTKTSALCEELGRLLCTRWSVRFGGPPERGEGMGDGLADVLGVMVRDHLRIEAGLTELDRRIARGTLAGPVGVAVLDLDGSAAVRARGLAAKRHVVEQFQHLVRRAAPAGVLVLDSGTRDEMVIVQPSAGHRARALVATAEEIRLLVRQAAFELPDCARTVRMTVSIGIATVPGARSAEQLVALGREGLAKAKSRRDCVAAASLDVGVPVEVNVPVRLAEGARDAAAVGDLVSRGIRFLQEKHEPMWHWVAEQGGADTGTVPRLEYLVGKVADPAGLRFFELLVAQISMEAAVTAIEAAGTRLEFEAGARRPPSGVLTARFLPGEWVVARPAGGQVTAAGTGNVFTRIQLARQGDAQDPAVFSVMLPPNTVDVLARISARRGRSTADLLDEALWLENDRALIGAEAARAATAGQGA